MCGIVGFVGPYREETLHKMNDLIRHRGPDDSGDFYSSSGETAPIGIAMRRLSIIDLESGKQPIWNEDQSCTIFYNGELYNYKELRQRLVARGHQFSTQSDTEVILHGYEEFGEAVLDHLEGMFAFAIWDVKRHRLLLARDRLGIKPLYYTTPSKGVLLFGSEIKPLLSVLDSVEINKEALYHYLLFGFALSGPSIFDGIHHLLPGHFLVWENGDIRISQYWSIAQQAYPFKNQSEWEDALQETLYDAVESHLIADVPVGLTLSGGLDSSSVLALMSRAKSREEITAFTLGYGLPNDELPYAKLAATYRNTSLTEVRSSLARVAEDYSRILYHLEEPIAHPVLGTTFHLAEALQGHLKVVLIGEGSDELFAGYPHYRLTTPPYSLAPHTIKRSMFFKIAYLMPDVKSVKHILAPEWLDRSLLDHVAHRYDHYFTDGRHLGEAGLHCELEAELVGNQLLRIDKLMMAHSIEARVPFLDRAFVELAYSIPFSMKRHNGQEKYILRQAMKNLLPEDVINRPKSGPKGTQGLLDTLVEALTSKHGHLLEVEQLNQSGIFQGVALKDVLDRPLTPFGKWNPITSRQKPKFALAILTFQLWWKVFFEEKSL